MQEQEKRMTTELAIQEQQGLSTQGFDQAIGMAHKKAETLKRIVEDQKLYVDIGPSRHLRVEAWQTMATAYKLAVRTDDGTKLIYEGAKIVGVEAKATVIDIETGIIVGGATSYCFQNEQGKEGQAVAQLAGMAQTRASARALKQNLSWVVVLAGYSPTPAEEMMAAPIVQRGSTNTLIADQGGDLLCPIHNINFFKAGKMRDYAHVVEGETGPRGGKVWCNQAEVLANPPQPMQDGTQEPQDGLFEDMPVESPTDDETTPRFDVDKLEVLLTWAELQFGLNAVQVAKILSVEKLQDIKDFKGAQNELIASQRQKGTA
jgi:hypothetical protein